MDSKRQLVFSVLEFLQTCVEDGTVKSEDVKSLEAATQSIGKAFDVDITNESQKSQLSIKPANLLQIFNVYLKTQKKTQEAKADSASASQSPKTVSEEDKKKAEEFKSLGNKKVIEKNYTEAVKLYSQAIDLVGGNAVYYANRAAAYSQLNDQDNAIKDSLKSAEIDPSYAKAYSRLGHAYYCKEEFSKAIEAYEKASGLDPNNANIKSALNNCIQRSSSSSAVTDSTRSASEPNPFAGAGAGGLPGGLPGADALGGMDFASLMSNPMIRNMANQFMQSGAMNDVMRDPSKMMEMAQQFMGGANGAPGGGDNPLASLMNNPEMARLAEQFGANGGINPPNSNPSERK